MRTRWILWAIIAPFASGCAGVYAEAGLSVLPSTHFTADGAPAGQASPSSFSTTAVVTLGVGADFDIARKFRLTAGYESDRQTFSPGAQDSFGGGAARFDATLVNVTERLKFRGSAGFSIGQGVGSASMTGAAGTPVTLSARQSEGGSGLLGIGLTYYLLPFFALHALAGPDVIGSRVPGGSEIGIGGTLRLAASIYFGDTRPDAIFTVEHSKNHRTLMAAIAAGARTRGCNVDTSVRDSLASTVVRCPPDGREAFFTEHSEFVEVRCPHRGEHECRHELDELLDVLGKKPAK